MKIIVRGDKVLLVLINKDLKNIKRSTEPIQVTDKEGILVKVCNEDCYVKMVEKFNRKEQDADKYEEPTNGGSEDK